MGNAPLLNTALAALLLSGCSSLVTNPQPLAAAPSLAIASDERVEVAFDTLLGRNARGAWVHDADWDEYRFRIAARKPGIHIREIVLVDATGARVEAAADRVKLIHGSREVEARYKVSRSLVRSTSGGWVAASGSVTAVGSAALFTAMTPVAFAGGAGLLVIPVVGVAVGGVLGGVGLARMADHAAIDNEIKRRATPLPLAIAQASENVVVFFPVTPLPARIEITYTEGTGEHRLAIDTRESLVAAHAEPPPSLITRAQPLFPRFARLSDVTQGHVKARLSINPNGSVADIRIIESQPPGLFDREAKTTWNYFRYTASDFRAQREVEDTMVFKDPTR